ncbi:hypothetical protein [Lancefieldella rimae]|uniref:Uncharacterized protein n=1 Tax=Lancefieldella rimae (strain ATCC 49626 / DSM 7090 / CCUG 31168 / NBRC 15546 / VPI D140H-11A) TaxID=553184 RepID=B9CLA7_LANR4|nr:hypothetical protein [Lancefieldella rimae]EEE17848.1 hypothetical protein ATORI0001_0826 [Lancefieldella rimae ATCC 49626]
MATIAVGNSIGLPNLSYQQNFGQWREELLALCTVLGLRRCSMGQLEYYDL